MWRCERCGQTYRRREPPCGNCGHHEFEWADPDRPAPEDEGPATFAWVCTECGREHPKHAPPCSRCGNMELERRELEVDPDDLSAPSYRELASRGYLVALALAVAGLAILGLGVAGVVDVPGLSVGPPEPPEAPGDATTAAGTSLATVEDDYLAAVNDGREAEGTGTLRRSEDLDALATYYNRWRVRAEYGDEEVPTEAVREYLRDECRSGALVVPIAASVDPNGSALADLALESGDDHLTAPAEETGVDVHAAPDGRLYLTQVLC